jgi:hypothetical protein
MESGSLAELIFVVCVSKQRGLTAHMLRSVGVCRRDCHGLMLRRRNIFRLSALASVGTGLEGSRVGEEYKFTYVCRV